MDENLKTVEFKIKTEEQEGEMFGLAIVSKPAMEATALFLSEEKIFQPHAFSSDDKMEITGLAMRPNKKILRYNQKTKEYFYCVFSAETVRQCAQLFFKHKAHVNLNIEHISGVKMPGVYAFESWVVEDIDKDKTKALGIKDVKVEDWFITIKVDNVELWKSLKERYNNGYSGFSIEGNFYHMEETETKKTDEEIYNIIVNTVLMDNSTPEKKVDALKNTLKNWTK